MAGRDMRRLIEGIEKACCDDTNTNTDSNTNKVDGDNVAEHITGDANKLAFTVKGESFGGWVEKRDEDQVDVVVVYGSDYAVEKDIPIDDNMAIAKAARSCAVRLLDGDSDGEVEEGVVKDVAKHAAVGAVGGIPAGIIGMAKGAAIGAGVGVARAAYDKFKGKGKRRDLVAEEDGPEPTVDEVSADLARAIEKFGIADPRIVEIMSAIVNDPIEEDMLLPADAKKPKDDIYQTQVRDDGEDDEDELDEFIYDA